MLWQNNKNKHFYEVLDLRVLDATNSTSYDVLKIMVLYKDMNGDKYVREATEFYEKFTKTNIE